MTAALTPEQAQTFARLQQLVATAATDDEARAVAAELRAYARRVRASRWEPYPWQHPHTHPEGWVSERAPGKEVCDERCLDLPLVVPGVHEVWKQRGGRGTGKTDGAAHYVNTHMEGPACDPRVPGGHRITIAAPTQPDAVSSCVTGVSGVQAINPAITVTTTKEGTIVRWPNGAVGRVLGAHDAADVQRARAWTNVCLWWLEEAAAMNYLGGLSTDGGTPGMLDQAPFTLRLGSRPHLVVTTTPTGAPEVTALLNRPGPMTWGRTQDAHRLDPAIRASLEALYRGTTLGRQELDGEQLADVPGSLWVYERPDLIDGVLNTDDRPGLNNDRVPVGHVGGWTPHLTLPAELRFGIPLPPPAPEGAPVRVDATVVGVDPAGGATENGISVVGASGNHGYVLADLSVKGGPDAWGKIAVLAYLDYGAVGIALERTYGGDQTEFVIQAAAEALGVPLPPILKAPTPEGKKQRALPLQALAQQHRFHMVGHHPKLEGELTTWVEDDDGESPNRLDAMVHAGRHLLVRNRPATVATARGRRLPGR